MIRTFALGVLAAVLVAVGFVWATEPSADAGEMLLRAETPFTKGRYYAYASPWGGRTLTATRAWSGRADGIAVDLKHFPQRSTFQWRWPPVAPSFGPGVWGYNHVAYGNYDGGHTEQPVDPVRVRDLKSFGQSFRWSMANRWGDANVLTEFYLRGSPTDAESRQIEIGWLLRAPRSTLRFFERSRLIGTYVDPAGGRWTVRMNDKFCMFAPASPGDVRSGKIDMLHALRWLQEKRLVSGEEWLWGVAMGAEPVAGIGSMTLHEWKVVLD